MHYRTVAVAIKTMNTNSQRKNGGSECLFPTYCTDAALNSMEFHFLEVSAAAYTGFTNTYIPHSKSLDFFPEDIKVW